MRKLSRLYAWIFGYFWLACPRCDKMFGGHEAGEDVVFGTDNKYLGRICCKFCTPKTEDKFPRYNNRSKPMSEADHADLLDKFREAQRTTKFIPPKKMRMYIVVKRRGWKWVLRKTWLGLTAVAFGFAAVFTPGAKYWEKLGVNCGNPRKEDYGKAACSIKGDGNKKDNRT